MKLRWLIPVAFLVPLRLSASDAPVGPRVATIPLNSKEVTVLHLRPEFESTIRMPEEITSVNRRHLLSDCPPLFACESRVPRCGERNSSRKCCTRKGASLALCLGIRGDWLPGTNPHGSVRHLDCRNTQSLDTCTFHPVRAAKHCDLFGYSHSAQKVRNSILHGNRRILKGKRTRSRALRLSWCKEKASNKNS